MKRKIIFMALAIIILFSFFIGCVHDNLVDPEKEETKKVEEKPEIIPISTAGVVRELRSHGQQGAKDLFSIFENTKKYIYISYLQVDPCIDCNFLYKEGTSVWLFWNKFRYTPVQIVVDKLDVHIGMTSKVWGLIDKNGQIVGTVYQNHIYAMGECVDFVIQLKADSLGMNENPRVPESQSVYGVRFAHGYPNDEWGINHFVLHQNNTLELNILFPPEELRGITLYYGTNPEKISDVLWTNEIEFLERIESIKAYYFNIYFWQLVDKLKPETVYYYKAITNDGKYKSHIQSFKYSPQLYEAISTKNENGNTVFKGGNNCYLLAPYNGAIGVKIDAGNVSVTLVLYMIFMTDYKQTGNVYWGTDSLSVQRFSSQSKRMTVSLNFMGFLKLPISGYGQKIYWRAEFCDRKYITPVYHFTTQLSPTDPNATDYR